MSQPLIVTSLNPYGKLDLQRRCFEAWAALGLRRLTVNVAEEAEQLRAAGIPGSTIRVIDEAASARAIHGRAVPRLQPLIEDLPPADPLLIVNADIWPALRTPDTLTHWSALAPALALTREECGALETHAFGDIAPYRGGLDAFLVSADARRRLREVLAGCEAAPRMAFGIPGWDFLVGAAVISEQIGGRILDSGLLLHESHRTTYASVDEFAHYAGDMTRLAGLPPSEDAARMAERFAARIDAEAAVGRPETDLVRAMHYRRPPPDEPASAAACAAVARLAALDPALAWSGRLEAARRLADRALKRGDVDFDRAVRALGINPDPQFRLRQTLWAIHLSLTLRAGPDGTFAATSDYPPQNLHADTLAMIREACPAGSAQQRLEIAVLFGAELVDYAIFNPRLRDYLVESCETDEERALLTAVTALIRRPADALAPA